MEFRVRSKTEVSGSLGHLFVKMPNSRKEQEFKCFFPFHASHWLFQALNTFPFSTYQYAAPVHPSLRRQAFPTPWWKKTLDYNLIL